MKKPFPAVTNPNSPYKALGITCGIGSLLIGAYQAGCNVVGNIEWRKYYHHLDGNGDNSFRHNFPDAFFIQDQSQLTHEQEAILSDLTIAAGHPECGNFSILRHNRHESVSDPGDIPLFIRMVARFKPRYFFMDDLPDSFLAFPMGAYHELLPDYDLFPEWISNHHYGNIQKKRNRFFMIGALKSERFVFQPGEKENPVPLWQVIEGCEGLSNHREHSLTAKTGRATGLTGIGEHGTYEDIRDFFKDKKDGTVMEYHARDGQIKKRLGLSKAYRDGHCFVLTGTNPIINPETNLPFSLRERLRIQGAPDDFELVGEVLEEDGTWSHDRNNDLVKSTGKFMPVQFGQYFCEQVIAHIEGRPFETSGKRMLPGHAQIDSAKLWYCHNVGYGEQQEEACQNCWMGNCAVRKNEYVCPFEGVDSFLTDIQKSPVRVTQPRGPRKPREPRVNVNPRRPKEFDEAQFKRIVRASKMGVVIQLLLDGKTIDEVSKETGTSRGNICSHIQNMWSRNGIPVMVRQGKLQVNVPEGVNIFI